MAHYPGHVEDTGGTDQNSGVIPMTGLLNILEAPIFDKEDRELVDKNPRGRRKVEDGKKKDFKKKKASKGYQVVFINNNMVDFEEGSIVGYELIEVGTKIFVAINLEVEEVGTHTWSFEEEASSGANEEIKRIAILIKKFDENPTKAVKKLA